MDNSKTWGEYLNNYKKRKVGLKYDQPKVNIISRQKGKRYHRDRNPITHNFYDQQKEKMYRKKEHEYKNSHFDKAIDKQLHSESHYNVINMIHKKNGVKTFEPVRARKKNKSSTLECGKDYDTLFLEYGKKKNLVSKKNQVEEKNRTYNILTNIYKKDDQIKKKTEKDKFSKNIMRRYNDYKSKTVNPLIQKKVNIKYPKIKKEKYVYLNPITCEVTDEKELHRREGEKIRKLLRHQKRQQREHEVIKKRKSELQNIQRRKNERLNRGDFDIRDRNVVMKRGYDIVNNRDFTGLQANKPKWYVEPKSKDRSMWNKLTY